MLGTSYDIELAIALALLWVWFCCLRDYLLFEEGHMHREHNWFIIFIEPERSVIRVWWFLPLPDAFDLSIDPGAVTRTLVLSYDQPPSISSIDCVVNTQVGLEGLV